MLSRCFATIMAAAALVPGVVRAEVAGKWVAEITSSTLLEPAYIRVVLAQTGDAVSGAWGTEIVKGTVKGSTVSLALTDTGAAMPARSQAKSRVMRARAEGRWRAWDAGEAAAGLVLAHSLPCCKKWHGS